MKKLIPFLLLVNCLFAFAQGTKAQIIQTIAGTGGGGTSSSAPVTPVTVYPPRDDPNGLGGLLRILR